MEWGRIHILIGLGLLCTRMAMADPVEFKETFKSIGSDWHVAEYTFSHPHFDTDWKRSQVDADGELVLKLDPQTQAENRFVGGSLRREEQTHFGRYEVTLQAARGDGLVTGFFTYTGPYYGTQHDEIDIEFLGRDTSKMHVAWFVDGALTNKFIDLGFDAADQMTTYAFEWHPNALRWFVKDKLVFEHLAKDGPIPLTPSRLFVNIWAADPSISIWAGTAQQGQSAQAKIDSVTFTPLLLGDDKDDLF